MPSQPQLGKRLVKLRQDRGLSQREVGGEELSASYVSLLEAGKREPTPQVLAVLAERLGTSMEHLRDGVEPSARRRVELEMRYAELARRSSEPAEARDRFAALVADPTTA